MTYSSRLSLIRKSHVASFQGCVVCVAGVQRGGRVEVECERDRWDLVGPNDRA